MSDASAPRLRFHDSVAPTDLSRVIAVGVRTVECVDCGQSRPPRSRLTNREKISDVELLLHIVYVVLYVVVVVVT